MVEPLGNSKKSICIFADTFLFAIKILSTTGRIIICWIAATGDI